MTKKRDTGESIVWKNMMLNKVKMEPHIHWKINSGSYSFWWDNWLGMGLLTHFRDINNRLENTKVSAFIHKREWDVDKVIN